MGSELESAPFLDEAEKPRLEHWDTMLSAARRTKASISSGVASHLTICLITSFFWGALLHFMLSHNRTPQENTTDAVMEVGNVLPSPLIAGAEYLLCGHSTEEAKTLGCEYDILSNHWLPAPCMGQDAIREYQSDESWFEYADENRTQVLSIDEMSEVPFYYTNMRDHILYCAMLWRKQYKALYEERQGLDSIIVDEEHTLHCSDFLVRMTEHGPDFSKIPIKVEVGFAGCHLRGDHHCN